MTLDSRHEYPLMEKPDVPMWSENFALVASDADNGLSVFYSIGTWYGDTTVWREVLGVALPDGQVCVAKNYGRNTSATVVSASLTHYEIVDVEKKVRLGFRGPVWRQPAKDMAERGCVGGVTTLLDLDMTFDATAPLWDMAHDNKDKTNIAGGLHTEQLGRCNGKLKVGEHEFSLRNVASNRDHSRGPRDGTRYRNHCWIQGDFPGGRAFQLYAMRLHSVEGIAMAHATIIDGGKHHPATVKQLEFVNGANDARKPHTIILGSDLGDMQIEVQKVFAHIPLSFVTPWDMQLGVTPGVRHAHLFEESATMMWDGKAGIGWNERGYSAQPLNVPF